MSSHPVTLQATLQAAIKVAHAFADEHPREIRADSARTVAVNLHSFLEPGALAIVPFANLEAMRMDATTAQQDRKELRARLSECVTALERLDARLLSITFSPRECELGEIVRARAALLRAV